MEPSSSHGSIPALKKNKLPRNFFEPFVVNLSEKYKPPLYATFLPQVLWLYHPSAHKAMFSYEISYLKASKPVLLMLTSSTDNPVTTQNAGSSVAQVPHQESPLPQLLHYLSIAPYIIQYLRQPELPPPDLLYYMERFFGHCLIDRTGVLKRSVAVRVLDPIPPMLQDFNMTISQVCEQRARDIFERAEAEGRSIEVLWSGGIDSTSLVVALLRVGSLRDLSRVTIVYTKASEKEYPLFKRLIAQKLKMRKVKDLESIYDSGDECPPLIVTGELGDQIFGSMFYNFFYDQAPKKTLFYNEQNTPWRAFMPDMLVKYKVIPRNAKSAWLKWIEPQVQKCPIPVLTVFDMFWWLNFSLKWQHVSLRIMLMYGSLSAAEFRKKFERTVHFFNTDVFQQWSFTIIT